MADREGLSGSAVAPAVLAYTNVTSEYEALRRRAIVVNRSHRGRTRFSGSKAADVLTGLVTNDVGALQPGQGQYAVALTPKGKVVADLRVLRFEDGLVTDTSPRCAGGWMTIVRKYVNPRLAKYADESSSIASLGVFGVQARYVVEEISGIGHSALALLPPYAHVTVAREGTRMTVMRSPELLLEGYEIWLPAEAYDACWKAAIAARATPAGVSAWEIARVEAGRPEWGLDMDENTLPQEANLEQLGAISYTKGCYTGQEVVARVHFRGHVNRTLRGLRASGSQPPAGGATLVDATGKEVGDVRTGVSSPRLGGVALGMVRREVENGAQLIAKWSGNVRGSENQQPGEMPVDVVALPFPLD